jgi:hypothetical protein
MQDCRFKDRSYPIYIGQDLLDKPELLLTTFPQGPYRDEYCGNRFTWKGA